jgi:nicotinate-nucleotide pyrophosphorylase (carboxylating)
MACEGRRRMISHQQKQKLLGFLRDDLGRGDVTSALLSPQKCRAGIVARENCIVAGLEEARFLFNYRKVRAAARVRDGSPVKEGQVVMVVSGENRRILEVERTALNVISRMSAVATACSEAKRIAGGKTIALTRKTIPGFNLFDKKAAALVGVWRHRLNLNEAVLVKENHLVFFSSPREAVERAKRCYGKRKAVEVEAESLKEALDAAMAGPDIIMLDNFPAGKAKRAAEKLRESGYVGKIELSGGVSFKNLKEYAAADADVISMGCLTQSVAGKNFSLEMLG